MIKITPIQVEKRFEILAMQLREEIISGEFNAGDLLSEMYLMERSGLSRGSVRDALRVLEAQGLIETRRGRNGGSYVVESSVQTIVESLDAYIKNGKPALNMIMDTVQLLEPGLARLAAINRTAGDIVAMSAAVENMSKTDETHEFVRRNTAWHMAMAQATHNSILGAIYQPIGSALLYPRPTDFLNAKMCAETVNAARKILEAIVMGNPGLAQHRMHKHVNAYHQILKSAEAEYLARLKASST